MISYSICLSLCDLFHEALYSLGVSTVLQMEAFRSFSWFHFCMCHMCVSQIFLTQFFLDGHLGCLHVIMTVVNGAAMNIFRILLVREMIVSSGS